MRITSHVIHFTGWSAGELKRILSPHARMPLANWQVTKKARHTWIVCRLHEFIAKEGDFPAGYEIRRCGQTIESGLFAWPQGWNGPVETTDVKTFPFRKITENTERTEEDR